MVILLDANLSHDDVIKWKHFPRHLSFVRGIHRSIPLTKASDAELWCFLWSAPWINGWVNNREAGALSRHRVHYDVIIIIRGQTSAWLKSYDCNLECANMDGSFWGTRIDHHLSLGMVCLKRVFRSFGAEIGIFQGNKVNIIAADHLVPFVTRPSAAIPLTKWFLCVMRKNSTYLRRRSSEEWHRMQIYLYIS